MTPADIGSIAIAVVFIMVAIVVSLVARRAYRDEIYTGVTPGALPGSGAEPPTAKVSPGREYSGEIAVQFHPPRGIGPGLVGTIIDDSVDAADLTATIVDLAVRGFITISPVDKRGERLTEGSKGAKDWVLTKTDPAPTTTIEPMEQRLLNRIFARGDETSLSQLGKQTDALKFLRSEMYERTVAHRWYRKSPLSAGSGAKKLIMAVGVIAGAFIALQATPIAIISGIAIAGSMLWLAPRLKKREPRTAEGTALRIQALGFKKYLATAEADQLKFEEAALIFSRYLPYAIAFGVAEHWTKVFGDVAARAKAAGYRGDGFDIDWVDAYFITSIVTDSMHLMMLTDALSGADFSLLETLGDLGDVSTDIAEGVGEIVSGIFDGFDL